jgi:S1-C subfamily serine protease
MNKKTVFLSLVLLTAMLFSGCSGRTLSAETLPAVKEEAKAAQLTEQAAAPTEAAKETKPTQESKPAVSSGTGTNSLVELQSAYTSVYDEVAPSVVNIRVVTKALPSVNEQFGNMPDLPFNMPEMDQQQPYRQEGLGSGFVWDTEGHIVTNNHVVDGADQITVTFADGESVAATLVGADPDSDLAVIKVDVGADRLKPLSVADSTEVKVGQISIAIGNPFGLQGTMTTGIVSALGRSLPVDNQGVNNLSYIIPDVIQTDAPINPGNSGGVLVNIDGELMGVTTAIESTTRSSAGIGYAVPSVIVKNVVPDLIANGKYEHTYIGISGQPLTSELAKAMDLESNQHGALVVDVTPGSPAENAGIKGSDRDVKIDDLDVRVGGDIITAIDDQPVNDFEDLVAFLARSTRVGQTVTLTVIRDKTEMTLDVELAARATSQDETTKDVVLGGEIGSPWLGIRGATLTEEVAKAMNLNENQKGVLVQQVVQGSPADKARLNGSFKAVEIGGETVQIGGDVISAVDGKKVETIEELQQQMADRKVGETITLTVLRDGSDKEVEVKLEARPEQ